MHIDDCFIAINVIIIISFSDNGMLVIPGVQYNMTFTSWQPTTANVFKNNIKTRYDNISVNLICCLN